ncbi:two-component system QseEF-associated lipoprotein QseG [Citrobacter freundii]|uniref:two-component system QseEF-associated lipoprotein QseG n=1 Tax=Citrobacter sp. Cm046 TaxID=2985118 RepID=UPI0018FFD849|nr:MULTISPECIES: two-component system QseEF-associated lipoprotein QseG [Citrobacter]MBJ9597696.1 two-component system QseEF-associated lipoprotein QseG [Citrobacter werkmanii]MBJ9871780.1 two-component system QseEF-associated lipoprotein QseG [Citrobacter werkmanii]MDK2361764.1 two-component system QseEF-associated lipoprotein QseG [Citrobacter freundii]MDM2928434.1 two-component system QseEF-associated lipoprotein QseG [Citrobacter sp. Cm046]HAU4329817.1 two-component system QseEF-associated
MPHVVVRMLKRHFFRRALWVSLPCLALVGCVPNAVNHIIGDPSQEKIPPHQLADYLSTECADIWSLQGQSTESNPLYWLRAMDCADRMMAVQARSEASAMLADTWQGAFKRGILLGSANITPPERRDAITRLDALSPQIPAQVRPLYQVWRSSQTLQLQLAEERMRYSKLQQASDSDLDTLRLQQQHLQAQLDLTTRKLENLTDIERQLSTRKPAGNYSPDTQHGSDKLTTPDNGDGAVSSSDEVTP